MVSRTGPNGVKIFSQDRSVPLEPRIDQLRFLLRQRDPFTLAVQSGTSFYETFTNQGEFCIPYFGREHKLSWPKLEIIQDNKQTLSLFHLAFFLYYLSTSDGRALSDCWVDFSDLPGGRIYAPAFHGYTGQEFVKKYRSNMDEFEAACISAGGQWKNFADSSFEFNLLPRLPLRIVYWRGDEEFPASCNILFDSMAVHYLPVDGCAIAGSMLVRKIICDN